mgnify:CR=1 FL=1
METESQAADILKHLQSGKSITPIDALAKFGCFRLSARIYDLRADGHTIYMERETDERTGKNFARYSYIQGEEK